MEVADRIVVMNGGRIEQVGTPTAIYDEPASPFVFSFVGDSNILPAPPRSEGTTAPGSTHYVRPQDLEILVEPSPGACRPPWPRCRRAARARGWSSVAKPRRAESAAAGSAAADEGFALVDAELSRQEFDALRQRWALEQQGVPEGAPLAAVLNR